MKDGVFSLNVLTADSDPHTEDAINWQQKENLSDKGMTNREKKRKFLLNRLYNALQKRCLLKPPPEFDQWVSTRTLAEDCDLGIYQTRSLLLKLVEQKKIIVTPTLISNSLRWYIAVENTGEQTLTREN